jgi:glycine/D-amino acid oxidase-like deaminating enzyme
MPDAVIVGGGIIGAACAQELASRGLSVTLVEREGLAAGASGRNQGWFVLSEDEACGPMSRASLPTYLEIAETSAVPVRFDRENVGHVMFALDEPGVAVVRRRAQAYGATGVHVGRIERLGDVEPSMREDVPEAWFLDQGRRVDPGALTIALALRAKELGAQIRRHETVRALTTSRDRVTGVATDEGVIAADTVILAAGPWSEPLVRPLGVSLPVTGGRGWIVELAGSPGLLRHLVEEETAEDEDDDPNDVPTAAQLAREEPTSPRVAALLHSTDDGTVVCGASHHPALRPEAEDTRAPARIAERAVDVVPALADARVRGIRWGIRPMSPDGRPIVGWLRDGLLAATGHGPEGVLLGGGTAALVVALIANDDPPFDPRPFDPSRF